jgi:iron complex outermembrane receptor protein
MKALMRAATGAMLVAPIAILGASTAAAQAAETDADELSLEEVVVTAQKRAENNQDVPIAITALSAETLAEKGITNIAQISDFTPNIQIDRASAFAGSSTIISAFIRGIGQSDFAFNMEPGVGLYVDGVYYARTVGAAVDLLDVERVEVLKGPQGTLFGRNTIGGAIHIVTRKPGEELAYQADVSVGNYDRQVVRGAIDIPLIEGKLYSSVSFSSSDRDGYQKRVAFDPSSVAAINPVTGAPYTGSTFQTDEANFIRAKANFSGSNTQGGADTRTARLKLLFTPSADVALQLAADVTSSSEEATSMTLLDTYSDAGTLFGTFYNTCVGGVPAPFCGIPRGTVGTSLGSVAATRLPFGDHFVTGDIDESYAAGSNFSDVRTWGLSGTLDWRFNDALSLKSISAYRKLESKFGVDVDASPEAMIDTSFTMNQEQFSEELQFNIFAFDGRLKSVVGAYYFTEKGDLLDTVTFGGGLLQVYGPNDLENDAWAAFTHNNFAVTDNFGVTFGARYTEETKYFTGGQSDLNNFVNAFLGVPAFLFPDPADTRLLFPIGRNRRDFDNTSLRVGAEYKLLPDVLAYASYAQGYKSGGWTTRLAVPVAVSVGAGAPVDPSRPPQHDPEEADTYEIGLKSELFDRRMRINTAIFRTDYTDMQIVSAPGFAFGAPWFFNAGEARIQGVEIEADAKATAALLLNASIGYLDAEYTALSDVAIAGGLTLDKKLVNVPKWSATLGGTYTFELANAADFAVHADYSYRDEMARDTNNTPLLISDSYRILNATLSYGPRDGRWQIVLGGENLTDERFNITGNNNPGVGAISATFNAPRTWYLSFKVRS